MGEQDINKDAVIRSLSNQLTRSNLTVAECEAAITDLSHQLQQANSELDELRGVSSNEE